ncbi:hypothetical protein J4442_04225, partial [Candidatus Woesearchaeota archaeon]|nr:hypothetical protein [Candidatus Woesearchaeota archaeon]
MTSDSIKGSNSDLNNILTDLNLSILGNENIKIVWSSSNKNVVATSGAVSRQSIDTSVTLTATLSKGSVSNSKSFTVVVKGTIDQDLLAVNNAKSALTDILVLNGNAAKDKVVSSLNLPTSLTGYSGVSISWATSNSAVVNTNGEITRSTSADGTATLTATLSKSGKSTTKTFALTVKKKVLPVVATNVAEKKVEISQGQDEIVIDSTNIANIKIIEIPQNVDEEEEIVINLEALVNNVTKAITLAPTQSMTLTRTKADATEIKAEIPQGTKIQGSSNWNGLITAPTVKPVSEVVVSAGTTETVIEVGFKGGKITFDKATKLTVPGQAGKRSGYVDEDGEFHVIIECTVAQVANPDSLPAEGECSTTSGSDVIIWTKHFTQFVTFTPSTEVCDGVDNDLDGSVDEGVKTTFYADSDGDGFGNANAQTLACSVPSGFVTSSSDCSDNNVNIKPGATEICDAVDNDCDGQIDEGSVCAGLEQCNNIDDDFDGQIDDGLNRVQSCGVGVCLRTANQVCTLGNWGPSCVPGTSTSEVANDGIDNDCDGSIDEGISTTSPSGDLQTYYYDYDGDGVGEQHLTKQATSKPSNYVMSFGDCRPADFTIYPGATELCNGVDNDCDNVADQNEGITQDCYEFTNTAFPNAISGVGQCSMGHQVCTGSSFSDQCLGDVGASSEACDGIDNDCDGQTDENFDLDGDGRTSCGTRTDGTDTVTGGVSDGSYDCNENNANIYAGASEQCNNVDEDCNGVKDDIAAKDLELADKQGGVCLGATQVCVNGEWEEPDYTEINNYEANELTCDGLNNDCDNNTDEGSSNYDGDTLADCVDPDVDGDGILDNTDFVFGDASDSDSNVPYSLVVAGTPFNGEGVNAGRYLLKLVGDDGKDLAWISYLFDSANVFDFRDVVLKYFKGGSNEGSALIISGINAPDSVRKAYLLKKLPTSTGLVCIKTSDIREASQISDECNQADEILISCTGRWYNGFGCEPRVKDGEDIYIVHGMNYYGVKEVSVIQSDFTRDGKIDYDDFFLFADSFGASRGQQLFLPMFDLDYDNQIDFDDFFK